MFLRFLFITLLLFSFNLKAEVRILKIVNGEAISNVDVKNRVSLMEKLSRSTFTPEEQKKAFSDALDNLVHEIILVKKAQEMNLDISEELARQKLETIAQQNSTNLKQYLQQHNIDYNDILQKTISQIALEKIITSEVVPYITVSDDEVDHFRYTIFELEKNDQYLGLFSNTDLSNETLNAVRKMKIGMKNDPLNIRLLDRYNVPGMRMHFTFNIIEISDNDTDTLIKKNINCQNYSTLVEEHHAVLKKNFTKGTTPTERKIYKELLQNNIKPGEHLKIGDNNTLVLICDVIKPENAEQIIKEKIFQNKLSKHTADYLKKLKRDNSIITIDNEK